MKSQEHEDSLLCLTIFVWMMELKWTFINSIAMDVLNSSPDFLNEC